MPQMEEYGRPCVKEKKQSRSHLSSYLALIARTTQVCCQLFEDHNLLNKFESYYLSKSKQAHDAPNPSSSGRESLVVCRVVGANPQPSEREGLVVCALVEPWRTS